MKTSEIEICKCGNLISAKDNERLKELPLKTVNVPVYPRCGQCLSILSANVWRLYKSGKKYNFTEKTRGQLL